MKILNLRFKNLNSLVGEWEIDLTHPAFASDGIFAITGPTGAGKTTILDAICLGLYGRTPRLNKVTKSGNEIMSRQTGECFAEVTFETQAGRFRCHWSQHRARRKPDGELQAPKHEIANAVSGEIFEAKLRGVAEQIEAATGMDFDRFTRSMLLAQGGFAAFLQAAPDERAPILEQITGTEIYSQISMRVHERRADERRRLDALQAELAGMRLLSPEEQRQLAESRDQKAAQDAELTQQIARKNQAIAWIEGIARIEEELKQLGQAKVELRARLEAFAPEQERLRLANQALELAADHAALMSTRKEQDRDRRTWLECRESLADRSEAARQAEDCLKTALEQLEARKADLQTAQPVIRKVRELDLKIAEKDAPIQAAQASVAEFSTSHKALQAKQQSDVDGLAEKRRALEELRRLLEVSKADGALVENLTGLRGRFDALNDLARRLTGKLEETAHADRQFQEALKAWQEQKTSLENERRSLEETRTALAGKQSERLKILEGEETAAWRRCHSVLTARKELIGKALEAVESRSRSRQATIELASREIALKQDEATLTGVLATQSEKQAGLETELGLLETQLTLLKKIEGFEEARGQLQDGVPCPLCGAREHPYAEGNIPATDETRQHLTRVRAELKSVTGDISDLKVRLAKVGKDLEQVASARNELAEKLVEAGRVIGEICSELPADPELSASDPGLCDRLKGLQEENSRKLSRATKILEAAESVETELATLRDASEKAMDSVAKREREAQAATHRKDSAEQLLERLGKEAAGYRDQQEKSLAGLRQDVQAFGVEALSIDTLDAAFEQLTARRDRWVARNAEKAGFEQKIAALEIETRHQADQLRKSENEIAKQQEQLATLLRDREVLLRERQELFEDQKPDDEEARLSMAIESADKNLESARQKLTAANQALGQLKTKIDELEKAIGARDLQLKSANEAFRIRLKASGFTDEENYQSACLPESDRQDLAQRSQKLADEQTALGAQEREKTTWLETERRKKITEKSLDALRNALAALVGSQKELQQEIGSIRQKLKDNESLQQQQQERLQLIEAQQRECARWDLLHELIGSADGKKYRNFAQGLTFEMMIGHANRQLQKLTDRYLLVRDDAQPLELNVIDNYQAGEVRSTKNLSGGESFIVSLSLALGLSHMASRNVRVDSLFLDEGFGTLDEEALDSALETLAGLQQDGKLIGVISHVPALKERIGTRIEVIPRSGGRSLISGPGCERIGNPVDA